MVAYHFSVQDLLRVRFAISPLYETTASLLALLNPASGSPHLAWVRDARARLVGLDLSMLAALVVPTGYTPEFLSAPPPTPAPAIYEQTEILRATPPAQVRRQIGRRFPQNRPPKAVEPLLSEPQRAVRRLAELLEQYWQLAIEPFWQDIHALLQDDIAARATATAAGGTLHLFNTLHADVRWGDETLRIRAAADAQIELAGRGLQLIPAVFAWPGSTAMYEPPWPPTLIYPPCGLGTLWSHPPVDSRSLAELVGSTRAQILVALDHETSTTELARRLNASPAGVSAHLTVLRRAGLLHARRQGHAVLYARTPAGDALLSACREA